MTRIGPPSYAPLAFEGVAPQQRNQAMTKSVPQALKDLGNLYEERNALYKDNYKQFGKMLSAMFPRGVTLKTEEEFNRFALFLQIVHKSSRYAHTLLNGGHADSLDDTSVYAQMLREYDGEVADERLKRTMESDIENEG